MLSGPHRLVASAEHRLVARRGRKGRSGPVVVSVLLDPLQSGRDASGLDSLAPSRAAVVVPKRVGTSVQRNRVQRQLRHLLRDRLDEFPGGSLSVIRAEPGAVGLGSAELGKHLDRGLQRVLTPPVTRGPGS
jgi:ribonuclease P protein component